MASFDELGLSGQTLAAVAQMGFTQATPVQEQAIPLILEGHDIMAAAQTGTGKTAAFVLPVLDKLDHFSRGEGPHCLIITPTRELAQQINDVAKTVAKRTRHWVLTVVGGLSYNPQINGLRRGIDVLVATPGRLLDLYERGVLDLSCVNTLVIDEADRMLDMGFWPDVSRILADLPSERQTLLFSATLDDSVMKTIGNEVKDPKFVEIAHKGTAAETVDQFVLPVSQTQKPELLKHILDKQGSQRVIVFTRTKFRAESLADRLYREGFSAEAIHGDRSQAQRSRALKAFKSGRVDVLVATDVLARGIDVSEVEYVINYDVPMDPEDYIHRIGRTGRAGNDGMAITFVTFDDTQDLFAAEYLMKKTVPEMELDGFDFDGKRPELDPGRDCTRRPRKGKKGRSRSTGRDRRSTRSRREGPRSYSAKPEGYAEQREDRRQSRRDDRGFESQERPGRSMPPRPGHASRKNDNIERTRRHEKYVGGKAGRDAALTGADGGSINGSAAAAAAAAFPIRNREQRRAERFMERGERGYRSASSRSRHTGDGYSYGEQARADYQGRNADGRDRYGSRSDRRSSNSAGGNWYDRNNRAGNSSRTGGSDRSGAGRDDRRDSYNSGREGQSERRPGYKSRSTWQQDGRAGRDGSGRQDERSGGRGGRQDYQAMRSSTRDDRRSSYGSRDGQSGQRDQSSRDGRRGASGSGRISSRYAQGSYTKGNNKQTG